MAILTVARDYRDLLRIVDAMYPAQARLGEVLEAAANALNGVDPPRAAFLRTLLPRLAQGTTPTLHLRAFIGAVTGLWGKPVVIVKRPVDADDELEVEAEPGRITMIGATSTRHSIDAEMEAFRAASSSHSPPRTSAVHPTT